ncbi:MAG TPA: branched-chain amino acid ABC transporter ATP-binding protein/permease [Actinomycetota bacterium]|nr:branched-chain amino acid ABC transporter ATP-binding protein/permease [Actinomycetota bacterium]
MTGPIPLHRLRPAVWGTAVIGALLVAGMLAVRSGASSSAGRTYVVFLVNVMLVVAIQTFIGNSGIVSFGHVAFMGIGAYVTALGSIPEALKTAQMPELPAWVATLELGFVPAIVAAAVIAAVVAAVFGGAIVRMAESTMAMATLALLVIAHTFFQNATTYTRGAVGLAGIPTRTTLGVAAAIAVAFVFVGRLYKESRSGLRLRATREDALSSASVGTNVVRVRYGGWILSGALMGAAGSVWAQNVIAFNANQFYFAITFALLAMLVVGGRSSVTGAVVGAAVITFMTDTLSRVEQGVRIGPWELPRVTGTVQFAIALLIIVTLILRPEGIFGRWEVDDLARRLAGRVRSRRRGAADVADVDEADHLPPVTDAPTVLEGRGVVKRFEGVTALDGVDIELRDGEVLGLIGPNGSGKTTLLNVVSGVQRPTEGRVVLGATDVTGWSAHRVAGRGLSRTFQNIRLFSELTARENVEAAAPTSASRADVDDVLGWFGLGDVEHQRARNLPYGVQRRLEIARAVIRRPSVLLLDEPAAGMNESESDELLANIRRIRSTLGCSVIVVDHDLRLIMKLCDRIQVLDQGRTIAIGRPQEIASDPRVVEAYLGAGSPAA